MSIRYYLEQAAADGEKRDLTSYYTKAEAPPGTWFGKGLTGLTGVAVGQTVTEDAAIAVFQDQADPGTGQQLGRPLMKTQAAPEGAKTPGGQEAKGSREGVAGFDLTFSPPKSISTLWALAGPELQGRIHAAHQQAVTETLAWVEDNVIQSRAGHGGVAHVAVDGMVASMFDHWDSRAGDPQLHTHAVIANRVQRSSDQEWVTLDSYTLHKHVVAISEMYNSVVFDRLAESVGAEAEARAVGDVEVSDRIAAVLAGQPIDGEPPEPVSNVQLAGVPDRLIEEFSSRSSSILARKNELIEEFIEDTGREPSNREILKMRQQATLENRPEKADIVDKKLPEKLNSWRSRTRDAGYDPDDIVRAAVGRDVMRITPDMLDAQVTDRLAAWALNDASQRRTTFTRANVRAATERVLRLVRCTSFAERAELVDHVVDTALASAVDLTPRRYSAPADPDVTVANRGESVFDHTRQAAVYTTQTVMDDEDHLISRTHAGEAPCLDESADTELTAWTSGSGFPLGADQLAAARDVLTSSAGISAIIGPAGTGKTTTMSAITDTWHAHYGNTSVIGMAPSAVAASVLGEEIGVDTDNVTKWLYESVGDGAARRAQRAADLHARLAALPADRVSQADGLRAQLAACFAAQAKYQFQPGQLVIVDEASMVPTNQLAELSRQAEAAGAKVLLVGDPAQLEAVEAGGFLGHMERNLDHSTLTKVWRFNHETNKDWEPAASLALREGDEDVLETYAEHGRLHGDPDADGADLAYSAWKADRDSGLSSILIAADNKTVAELNQRAHADLVESGLVDIETTARLRDDTDAGVGDVLLARRNDRQIRDSAGAFITNGTRLRITGIRDDGAVDATVESSGATILLDPDYLATSVQLGYATTAHRSQGVTVDTGHCIAHSGLSRELFYVAMTRGKQGNHAYVQFDDEEAHSPDRWDLMTEIRADTPMAVLAGVLRHATAERSAHEVATDELGWANDVGRLCYEADYLDWSARQTRTKTWVDATYPPETAERLFTSDQWRELVTADPATAHAGDPDPADTPQAIMDRCAPADTRGSGPAGMLPPVAADTAGQADQWAQLQTTIADQLRARESVLSDDPPEWFTTLVKDYPDPQRQQEVVTATLVWRAVSNQTEATDAWGAEPRKQDYLRPYWDRLQQALEHPPVTNHRPVPDRVDTAVLAQQLTEHTGRTYTPEQMKPAVSTVLGRAPREVRRQQDYVAAAIANDPDDIERIIADSRPATTEPEPDYEVDWSELEFMEPADSAHYEQALDRLAEHEFSVDPRFDDRIRPATRYDLGPDLQ